MQTYILLDLMFRTPPATFMLVLTMAIAAGLLVNHILQAGFYTTILSVPLFLLAGLFGNAFLILNHIILSEDKAVHIAMAACFGFILAASFSMVSIRVWARLRDKR